MNHTEYLRLHDRMAAYRRAVIELATDWVNRNIPILTIDNTLADPDACNIDLGEKITVEDGHFKVWIVRNYSSETMTRVSVPADLLDIAETGAAE